MRKTSCIEEKRLVRKTVQEQLGRYLVKNSRRPDWIVSLDRRTSVFITCSRIEDLWYDLAATDIGQWQSTYQRAFVIFVMGSSNDVLVIPLSVIASPLVKTRSKSIDGTYKLHIERTETSIQFKEIPGINFLQYRNKFELLS